jgi:2-keto-4-pentenoate hydratase/2-oxohepta-3-ene-1,7-dioic acid hydratase in catechol pathway
MRLATYSSLAGEVLRPALVVGERDLHDLPAEARARSLAPETDLRSMLGIIAGGPAVRAILDDIAREPRTRPLSLLDVRLEAPIPRPARNIFCVGWNYLEHFQEGANTLKDDRVLPDHPVFFTKVPGTVNGPTGTIPYDPGISTQLDWEVELGVIIGKGGKNISEAAAMDHVFGYTAINDVSWRDVQRRHGGQWFKGKSLDGTCPMGPWIVTADSLDCADLAVACRVNGAGKQASRTRFMYFKVPRLVRELSQGMTLEPGDIISTGTPSGVGYARTPPEWLKPGDLLETEIEGIGVLRNTVGMPGAGRP